MSTANEIAQKVMDKFLSDNRDLFACLKQTSEEVFQITAAAASLDRQGREEMATFLQYIDDAENFVGRKMAREGLQHNVYRTMARAFHKCLANGALRLAMKLTDEADQQQLELRYVCGMEQRPAPAPVVPVMSFDDQIRWDFANLPTDKIKAKKNANAQYRKRLNELLDGDTIKMQATTLHDGANL